MSPTPETRLDRAIQHLERLVGFPTISDQPNAPLIDWLMAALSPLGADLIRLEEAGTGKSGLLARLGPPVAGGIVLSGHTDVVPVAGQSWSGDPFTLRQAGDGRLLGRGAVDMKGFLACCLALAEERGAAGLQRPITLCFSYDEENTCLGVLPLIRHLAEHAPPVEAVVVGEPTGMIPVNQHKGAFEVRAQVTGVACHSSQPMRGFSAITLAAHLIAWLEGWAEAERAKPVAPFAEGFDPPYATAHCGLIQGGEAINTIAAACCFACDLRLMPGQGVEPIVAALKAEAERRIAAAGPRAAGAQVVFESGFDVPGLAMEPNGAAEALMLRLTGQNRAGSASFCTEGGLFQRAGFSTIICGPGFVSEAHVADEFIHRDQMAQCLTLLDRVWDAQSG